MENFYESKYTSVVNGKKVKKPLRTTARFRSDAGAKKETFMYYRPCFQ